MPRSPVHRGRWVPLFVCLALALLAAPPLGAQHPAGEAASFPREALTWFLAGDADRLWDHAGPEMRAMAESPQSLKLDAEEIAEMMGAETELLGERVFPHPEGGGWQVYLRAARHARVPEVFWLVIFSPAQRQVQTILAQTRQTVQVLFPQVELP